MKLNLRNPTDQNKAVTYLTKLIEDEKTIELKEIKVTRSTRLNSAMHLYFVFISHELNELGLEFNYTGISGKEFGLRYTPDLVKQMIWKPIMLAMFDIKTTTKLNSKEINEIIDVITKFFGDKGIVIDFPSIDTLVNK